jgi:hypothetical protein
LEVLQDRYVEEDEGPDVEPAAHDVEGRQVADDGFNARERKAEERAVQVRGQAHDSGPGQEQGVRVVAHDVAVPQGHVFQRSQFHEERFAFLSVADVAEQGQVEVPDRVIGVRDPIRGPEFEVAGDEAEVEDDAQADAELADPEVGLELEALKTVVGAEHIVSEADAQVEGERGRRRRHLRGCGRRGRAVGEDAYRDRQEDRRDGYFLHVDAPHSRADAPSAARFLLRKVRRSVLCSIRN